MSLSILAPLLSPLAKLLVSQGISFPAFSEEMKTHYLAAAKAEPGGKPTASRLSVLTGLQRRDISRLAAAEPKPSRQNPLVRLVADWQTELGGSPLTKNGPAPSFEALALSIRKDIHPRTLLDRLEAAGTVAIDGTEVRLLQSSYQPQTGSAEQLDYLGENVGDHLTAALENVRAQGTAPHFERAAHYSELTSDQIAKLEQRFRDGQMALLQELSQEAARMKREAKGKGRFRAGGYFYKVTENGDS